MKKVFIIISLFFTNTLLIFSQDTTTFIEVEKNSMVFNYEELNKIKQVVNRNENKKDYAIYKIEKIDELLNGKDLHLIINNQNNILKIEKIEKTNSDRKLLTYKKDQGNYGLVIIADKLKHGFFEINGQLYNIEPINSNYYILTTVDKTKLNHNCSNDNTVHNQTNPFESSNNI